jgi:hypothetical protein
MWGRVSLCATAELQKKTENNSKHDIRFIRESPKKRFSKRGYQSAWADIFRAPIED